MVREVLNRVRQGRLGADQFAEQLDQRISFQVG
jgi:hypothetical protein